MALVDLTLHCTALSATVSGLLVDWTGLDWTLQVAVAVVVAVAVAISRSVVRIREVQLREVRLRKL